MDALDFRAVFEGAPGLFLVLGVTPDFPILGASEAYLEATYTTREQAIGRSLFEVFPDNPEDPHATGTANLRASLERVRASRAPDAMPVQKYDIPRVGQDGFEERFWSPLNKPVLSQDGELRYIIHRVEDVTEIVRAQRTGDLFKARSAALEQRTEAMALEMLRRGQDLDAANQQLRAANEQLAELDEAKTSFFNNISHEFRTPLTLILGPVEDALHDASLPPAHRDQLVQVHRNAVRLLRLVNTLLDFTRADGRTRATFSPTDLAKLTCDIASVFRSSIERVGLELSLQCEALSRPAFVDAQLWERILLNLLSNALKHTFAGTITVSLREVERAFILEVADTGIGIPSEQLPHVFDRFHRVEGAQARSHEGSGIGLSLVRELARLHGGEVTATSEVGRGSRFTVTIPTGSAHLDPAAIRTTATPIDTEVLAAPFVEEALQWASSTGPSSGPAHARGRILVVDDNADLRRYVEGLLANEYQVEGAADGEAALAIIHAFSPELVLSDVMMPRLDGLGLVKAVRANPETQTLPIILLSARAEEGASSDAFEAGADDYLMKPFTARELRARVRTHLKLARARRAWTHELQRANRELEAFSYSVSHDLRAPLRAIDGFSKALLRERADALDDRGKHFLHRICAGAKRMATLIDDLLEFSRTSRAELRKEPLDLTALAETVVAELRRQEPTREVAISIAPALSATGDRHLMTIVFENLLGNAWKFTRKTPSARIDVGRDLEGFFVRDNGAGFDMHFADKLFTPFQRLHEESDFEGTGIGLATVQRILARHGGRVWATAAVGQGAAFYFTVGEEDDT